jgi:hypothetical protein
VKRIARIPFSLPIVRFALGIIWLLPVQRCHQKDSGKQIIIHHLMVIRSKNGLLAPREQQESRLLCLRGRVFAGRRENEAPTFPRTFTAKFPLHHVLNCVFRLIEMIRNRACCGTRKCLQEIAESLFQDEKRTASSRFVLAGHFARPDLAMSLLDLIQRAKSSAEYGGQFWVNGLGAKAFEIKKFDNNYLLRFFHLVEESIFYVTFAMILTNSIAPGRASHIPANYSGMK